MIRPAREDDWEGARALWREVDDSHAALAPAYFRRTSRAEREWRELVASADAGVFVAEAGASEVVGMVLGRVYETPPDPAMVPLRRCHVEMLVVGAAHQRRGLGKRLMDEVAAWARARGAAEIVLTVWAGNGAAEAFYERLGYSPLSRVLHTKLAPR